MAPNTKEAKKVKRPSAEKRNLQSEKRRLRNRSHKSSVRTAIRRFEESLEKKEKEAVSTTLSAVYSLLDKGVKTGVYKLNKASRTKARLTAKVAAVA